MSKVLNMQSQAMQAADAKSSNWSWFACAGGDYSSEASLFACSN